jgi:tetratricopeptide (TPR) repeat protein
MESIKSFLKRYSIDFQDIRFIFYSYSEVYNKLINFVILNLSDNLELSYRILSTSILAKNSEYYNNFGFVNIAKGNLDKAKDYIFKRLSFDPKDVLANYNLAVVYWLQKDYVSALDILKNKFLFVDEPNSASFSVVIPIYPFDKKVFLFDVKIDVLIKASLANLLFLSGQKEEAIKIFSKISIDYLKVTPSFYNYLLDSKNYIENN